MKAVRAFATADWPAAAYTTATLTMDELLAEKGREFVFEEKAALFGAALFYYF